MDMRVKEVLSFIDNFKITLSKYDEITKELADAPIKIASIESVRDALKKEIAELIKQKTDISNQASDDIAKANKQIFEQRESFERSKNQEMIRLTAWGEKLEKQSKEQAEVEVKQRHRESLLNEKERNLEVREDGVEAAAEDNAVNASELKTKEEGIAVILMDIKRQKEEISVSLDDIKKAQDWLSDPNNEFNKTKQEVKVKLEEVEKKEKELLVLSEAIKKEKVDVGALLERLDKEKKEKADQIVLLDKKKKDLDDKERALQQSKKG